MSDRLLQGRAHLYALALLVHLSVAALLTHPWDTFVFQRSISDLLTHGATPYETALSGADHIHLGRHLPALQHWWAYPPLPLILMVFTYWPAALGIVDAAWAGRVLIKLPAILATLALAATARSYAASTHQARDDTDPGHAGAKPLDAPRWIERWFLFNPLFILIAAVWGQLEALILVFLVLMVLLLQTGRWSTAGALWGLSLLVKPFAVFLAPVLGVHLAREGGRRAAFRFFATGLVLPTLVCLPFFLIEPRGFLQQTVFMHMGRPPARFAPLAGLYYLLREVSEASPGSVPEPVVAASIIGAVCLVLTLLVLLGLTLAFSRHASGSRDLLYWCGITFLGVLLVGKVLNEQYFLLPLGLLALSWATGPSTGTRRRRIHAALLVTTWGITVAGVLERAALLHWTAPDVLRLFTSKDNAEVFSTLAWSLGLSTGLLQTLLGIVAGLAVAGSILMMLRVLIPEWWAGWKVLVGKRVQLVPKATPTGGFPVVVVVLVVLVALPLGTTIFSLPSSQADGSDEDDPEPRVLAVYRTDWYNPTHDPERQEGTWKDAELAPVPGYLNLNAHKVQKDLELMKENGIEGLLIVLHPQHMQNAATVRRIAEAHGMPYATTLDLPLLESARGVEEDDRANRLKDILSGPPFSGWTGSHHMRDPSTGAPYLFIRSAGPEMDSRWERPLQDALDRFDPDAVLVSATEGDLGLGSGTGSGNATDTYDRALWLTSAASTPADYQAAWQQAVEEDPPAVVIPWNGFDRGWAVEPTREHDEQLLDTTRQGIERLIGQEAANLEAH